MAVARDAPQLERADLGDVRLEPHRHQIARPCARPRPATSFSTGSSSTSPVGVGVDQRAGRVVLARRRGEEPERRRSRRRPARARRRAARRSSPPRGPAARRTAPSPAARSPGSPASRSRCRCSTRARCRRGCARPCRGGPGRSARRRARPRDRDPRRRARATSRPAHAREQLDDARAAACRAFITPPLNSTARRHAAEPAEELGEVARDRRIVRVGQAHLAQTGRAAALGARVGADHREEAVDEQRLGLLARDLGLDRAADQLAAAAEDRDRHRSPAASSPSSCSLARRHAWTSARCCIASSVLAGVASCWPAIAASARSMLSPPSRM